MVERQGFGAPVTRFYQVLGRTWTRRTLRAGDEWLLVTFVLPGTDRAQNASGERLREVMHLHDVRKLVKDAVTAC